MLRLMRSMAIIACNGGVMQLGDYKTVLHRQEDGSWVAEIPAISGCYALMPTREEALRELDNVFRMIAEEYVEKGVPLPADTTEIVNA
jgi:predicted RNase H-like HicB family nuclease